MKLDLAFNYCGYRLQLYGSSRVKIFSVIYCDIDYLNVDRADIGIYCYQLSCYILQICRLSKFQNFIATSYCATYYKYLDRADFRILFPSVIVDIDYKDADRVDLGNLLSSLLWV